MFTKTKHVVWLAPQTITAPKGLCGVPRVFLSKTRAGADLENSTDLEKKHLPIISAPQSVKKGECFEVTVEVGKLLKHPYAVWLAPNEPGHHIEFIELYAGYTYLARMDFTARTTCPIMKLCLSLDHAHGKLRAFEHCNLHGTWEGDVDIEVTE